MQITLLTGNQRKKESLQFALRNTSISLVTKKVWLPEIQSIECEDVASFAAEYGANRLSIAVIKMDSGLFIEDLKGFPGALVHSVDEYVGVDRFILLLAQLKNRKAFTKNAIAYCEPNRKPIIFVSSCEGTVVDSIISNKGSFIDNLFIPLQNNHDHKTMGQIRKSNPHLAMKLWGNAEEQLVNWLKINKT